MGLPATRSDHLHTRASYFEGLTLGLVVQETVDLGSGTVEGADGETVISRVEDQVLAHDGQTDKTEISTGNRAHRSADIDAGETGTNVSDSVLLSMTLWTHEGNLGKTERLVPF